jgi:hypothetical protein
MTFQDSPPKVFSVPECDCVLCVVGYDVKTLQNGKCKGSDIHILTLEVAGGVCEFDETLIDHPSCQWRVDVFLRAVGADVKKGEAFEFDAATAKARGVKYIDPLGLQFHAHIVQMDESYVKDGVTKTVKKNKVSIFYTDKPKLPRRVIEPAGEPDDVPF